MSMNVRPVRVPGDQRAWTESTPSHASANRFAPAKLVYYKTNSLVYALMKGQQQTWGTFIFWKMVAWTSF